MFHRHDFMDEAKAFRVRGLQSLAADNEIKRTRQADEPRQSGATAPCGHETELRFRKTDARGVAVAGDAPVTGERHFKTASHTRAMDGGDFWNTQGFQVREDVLPEREQLVQLLLWSGEHGLQICSRNEDAILRAADDESTHAAVAMQVLDVAVEFVERVRIPHVCGGVRHIEGEPADALSVDLLLEAGGFVRGVLTQR